MSNHEGDASMSTDPINLNAPSYYVLPDGTELREVVRRFRGDFETAEHLIAVIVEYAIRAGNKPGVPMIDDARKVLRSAQQWVNVLEGRHVSDDGTAPPEATPAPIDTPAVEPHPTHIDPKDVSAVIDKTGCVHLYSAWILNANRTITDGQVTVILKDESASLDGTPPAPAPRKFKAGDRVALVRGCHDTHGVVVGSDLIDGRVCVNWPYGPNVMECPGALMLAPVEPAPAPPPAGLDLSRVAGYVRRDGVLHLYERATDAQADINQPGWAEGAIVKGVALHAADGRTIDAREAAPPPPPPAHAIPELPAGTTPTDPGRYWVMYTDGDIRMTNIHNVAGWESPSLRFAGPIPLPSFAREGREGGQDA
jgi:hypothetical protein